MYLAMRESLAENHWRKAATDLATGMELSPENDRKSLEAIS